MHDIDAQINKISGQRDYMEQLSKITGDIYTVDRQVYKKALEKCYPMDNNLVILSKRFLTNKSLNKQGEAIFSEFLANKAEFDIKTKTFAVTVKVNKKTGERKERENITPYHLPKDVVKSKWFLSVRELLKHSRSYLKLMFGKTYTTMELNEHSLTDLIARVPEMANLSEFLGITFEDEKTFTNILNTYKCAKRIVDEFMNPMYDVRATIERNEGMITKVFNKTIKKMGDIGKEVSSVDDIINILELFIIAKYRASLTGNNKHFMKMFMTLIDDDSAVGLDGSKFLDIIESLNLEQLNKNEGVYKFAVSAKTAINSIVKNKELDAEDVIAEIEKIMNPDNYAQKEDPKDDDTTAAEKFDNLLD